MRNFVLALGFTIIATLASCVSIAANDWSSVVKRLEASILYVESDEGACTGFVIDPKRKYVLTAAHCDGENLWVDRVVGKVVSKDTKKDLLVVEVPHLNPERQALQLATSNPAIGEAVMSAGFGYALERPMFRKANISDNALMIPEGGIGGPYIATDAAFVGGQSGGPVVNFKGEVVSIVQMASGTMGIGVGAEIIRERVGRFFEAR